MSGITERMGGMLDSILSIPDRPNHPAARKAARIAFDLLLIGIGVGIFGFATHFSPATLAQPSMTAFMAMPISFVAVGTGLGWLLQDIINKKLHRTAGKVMAVLMPLMLAAGAASLIAAGFHAGAVSTTAMGPYWFVGLLLLPLSFFAMSYSIRRISAPNLKFEKGPAPIGQSREAQRKVDRRRLANSQVDTMNQRTLAHRPPVNRRVAVPDHPMDSGL